MRLFLKDLWKAIVLALVLGLIVGVVLVLGGLIGLWPYNIVDPDAREVSLSIYGNTVPSMVVCGLFIVALTRFRKRLVPFSRYMPWISGAAASMVVSFLALANYLITGRADISIQIIHMTWWAALFTAVLMYLMPPPKRPSHQH